MCLFSGCSVKKEKELIARGEDLKIIVATDMHFLASDYHDGGSKAQEIYNARDGKVTEYSKEIMLAFVDTCLKEEADAVLLTGDLSFNGEKASHEEMAEMLQVLVDAGIDALVMPGNHDIRNPYAYSFKGDEVYYVNTVEAEDFVEIYANCGYDDAEMRDENSLSYLYKLSEDIWFLVLDVNGYEWNSKFGMNSEGKIKKDTLTWAEGCFELAKQEDATILVSTHHSLLVNEYLHSSDYRINTNATNMMKLMAKYGSYVNFSGHIHTQSIVSNEIDEVSLYEITTESLVVAGNNYGVVTIHDGELRYEAKSLDVDSWAKEQGLTDENLLNFHEYAWQHYYDVSYTLFLGNYEEIDVDQDVKESIAGLFAYLNPYYFSGNIDEVRDEVLNSESYRLVKKYKDDFSSSYLDSMLEEREFFQTELTISGIR